MPTHDLPSNESNCSSSDPRKQAALSRRRRAANIACNRDIDADLNKSNGDEDGFLFPKPNEPDDRSFIANYTKGMSHDDLGEVAPRSDYLALLDAVQPPFPPEPPSKFEAIPRGPNESDPDPATLRRYVNPQAGIAFSLMAPDPPSASVLQKGSFDRDPFPPAPEFSSEEAAAEMGEVYWMSLLREVPFTEYKDGTSSDLVREAAASLSTFEDFRGPKVNGEVTPQTLFRGGNIFNMGMSGGELKGPYLSQFLLIGTAIEEGGGPAAQFSSGQGSGSEGGGGEEGLEQIIPPGSSSGLVVRRDEGMVQYGAVTIDQRQREIKEDLDFMTDYPTWLAIQEGFVPGEPNAFTGDRKFMFNGRALANFVHFDQTYQTYYIAALLLLGMEGRANQFGVPLFGVGNPYNAPSPDVPNAPSSMNQTGFGTFGNGHLLALLGEADRRCLEAVWYQKWFVHRRLRPETFAGRIHNVLKDPSLNLRYKISKDILSTDNAKKLLDQVFEANKKLNDDIPEREDGGTFLLSQVFPEGSPMHPSYGAGHATEAGAGVTILKAFFNEDLPVTDPKTRTIPTSVTRQPALIANEDGTKLIRFDGPNDEEHRFVWEELNKLAANIAIGRNIAGVHYRTDYTASVRLGEYVALGLLQEQARNFNEEHFFQLTLFDNRIVRIDKDGIRQVGQR